MARTDPRGLGALLLGASLLGFAAIFTKWAQPASPLVTGFYRMAFALPAVGFLALRHRGPRPAPREAAWALVAGLCFVADLGLWNTALRHTSAASATLLVGLAPLWVALAMVVFLRMRLRLRAWTGLVLALAGAAVLGLGARARLGGGLGELLGGMASLAYGAYTLCLSRARRGLSAPVALVLVVLCALAGFGLLAGLRGDPFLGFPGRTWLALLGLGLVVQTLAWWLISWGLGHIPANVGSLGLLVQQVATLLLGWLLLGEVPSLLQVGGTVLILGGIALTATSPPKVG
jgi:drug/metabolite transporter (DMT)-like permease